MDDLGYIKKLNKVAGNIKDYFKEVVIRGDGISSFIFAAEGIYAVEIYMSENGVKMEFWENDEFNSTEREVDSYGEATNTVISWIREKHEK